jgi:hypothetical protein
MRTHTCEPGTEVVGAVVQAIVHNINAEEFRPFLEQQGISNPEAEQWYPLEKLMNVFNEMQRQSGAWTNFVALGLAITEYSVKPEGAEESLRKTLETWDEWYQVNHRNGQITRIQTVKHNENSYDLVLDINHNYPHDMVYGLVWGSARNLLPNGTDFTVKYDDTYNPKNANADKIVIHVDWK